MSRVLADDVVAAAVNNLFGLPETIEKVIFPSRSNHQETNESKGVSSIPVDILDSPKEYVFYMDVPGLSKSDIQGTFLDSIGMLLKILVYLGCESNRLVMVEDEKTLVIKSSGKRKHEDGEEEGCKYRRLERRGPRKLLRKFRLPENANVSAISAKCENGVLTVVVEKLPPPPKSKAVEVTIS